MTPETLDMVVLTYEDERDDDDRDIEAEHDRQREEDEASYAAHVSGPACGWRS